jgi:hypothetical protein
MEDKLEIIEYKEIYIEIKSELSKYCVEKENEPKTCDTRNLTKLIKEFFKEKYSSRFHVAGEPARYELINNKKTKVSNPGFLFDITIMSGNPKNVSKNENEKYFIHMAIESELGGVSAGTSNGIEKNLFEDFSKLLYVNSRMKVFIGAFSLGDKELDDKLKYLIDKFSSISKKSNNLTPILVILLRGIHDYNKEKGKQIQIKYPIEFYGFIIKKDKNCLLY